MKLSLTLQRVLTWLAAQFIDVLITMQEWFDHQNGVCSTCGHGEHLPGKCAGDPLDVGNSGPGGSYPQEPHGCLCGDPEFAA